MRLKRVLWPLVLLLLTWALILLWSSNVPPLSSSIARAVATSDLQKLESPPATRQKKLHSCLSDMSFVFVRTNSPEDSPVVNLLHRLIFHRRLSHVMPSFVAHKGRAFPYRYDDDVQSMLSFPANQQISTICCSPFIYNRQHIQLVLPSALRIALISHPTTSFLQSITDWDLIGDLSARLKTNLTLTYLLDNLDAYMPSMTKVERTFFTDPTALIFGLGVDSTENDVKETIEYIRADFDLVMIGEYLPEALILLKNMLCLSMQDVLYLQDSVHQLQQSIGEHYHEVISELNWKSTWIYEALNATFWRKVSKQPSTFRADVAKLKTLASSTAAACRTHAGQEHHIPTDVLRAKTSSPGDAASCYLMSLRDAAFFELLQNSQTAVATKIATVTTATTPTVANSSVCTTPEKRVVFLKTHKTGSSTISNLLNRYAFTHRLKSALPIDDIYYNWPQQIGNTVSYPEGKTADNYSFEMMCSGHAVYNRTIMNRIVPNARHITVIRHPVPLFIANWHYFGISKYKDDQGNDFTMESFLANPLHNIMNVLDVYRPFIHNILSFDFGLTEYPDVSKASEIIRTLSLPDTGFSFVLISEYMDESLVILRRKFCWTLEEVVTFSLKVTHAKRPSLSEPNIEKLKKFNQMDFLLYEHFNNTLWREIQSAGDIQKELDELRALRAQLRIDCQKYAGLSDHEGRFRLMTRPLDTEESRCIRLTMDSMYFSRVLKMTLGIPFKECVIPGTILDINLFRTRYAGRATDPLTNIFYRKAAIRNAPVALPSSDVDQDGFTIAYDVYGAYGVETKGSILAHGTPRYDDNWVRSFTKGEYGRYVVVVPNPVDAFMRAWHGLGIEPALTELGESTDIVSALASQRSEVITLVQRACNTFYKSFFRDQPLDGGATNNIVSMLNSLQLFLIAIPEDILETGFLYLQRLLCWDPDEFLYIPPSTEPSYLDTLDARTVRAIEEFNAVDKRTYDLVKTALLKKIAIELRFDDELQTQSKKRKALQEACAQYAAPQEQLAKDLQASLPPERKKCTLMLMDHVGYELYFAQKYRKMKHFPRPSV